MMTNLFSVFDPSSSVMNLSINWLSTLIGMMVIPSMFWAHPNPSNFYWNKMLSYLNSEFKNVMNPKETGSSLLFIATFTLIMLNNAIGLIPYIFTSTSHLMMTLSLSLPFWLTFMIFGWIKNTKSMLAHQVPLGTPNILMPFMVCIELISNIIRPGTLAIRLTANMIAGHLLLTLLGNTGTEINNWLIMTLMMTTQVLLFMLECAVAMIQSYVFSILAVLYSSEVK